MKQLVLKLSGLAVIALLSHLPSRAQDDQGDANQQKIQKERENKFREGDEIVIKRNGDKDIKVTVEVKGDQVYINGKPVTDFEDGDVVVKKMKVPFFDGENMTVFSGPKSPFRGGWSYGDGDMTELSDARTAFLGVSWEDVDKGAKINGITKESAAEKAGLMKGDIITKIGDTKIEKGELSDVIQKYKPEDKVTVTYTRDGKEQTTTATLGKARPLMLRNMNMTLPKIKEDLDFGTSPGVNYFNYSWKGKPRLGIKAQDLEEGKGAKVIDVDDDSPADKAGVKEGDIINEFDGKPVENADDLARLARENKEKYAYKLKLTRDGKSQEVEVKIPRKLNTADL